MAKQIEGVYERILQCATEEFLEKGYTDASLRCIAAAANTSTNSIYVRFKDKEGLFSAIVEPALTQMMEAFIRVQETFHGFDAETQRREMGKYTEGGMRWMLDHIYNNLNAFRLLLDASYGTRFQNFVDELVRMEVEYTFRYMETAGCPAVTDPSMTENLLHIVSTSYFEGMFEVIRHGMSREEAEKYMILLGKYNRAGFLAIFYPDAAQRAEEL